MSPFTQILNDVVSEYAVIGWNLKDNLKPGLDRSEIDALMEPFDFKLPPALLDLYAWHNGALANDGNAADSFLFGFRFLSLEESVAEYEDNVVAIPSLQPGWLPFMVKGSSNGDDDNFQEGDAFVIVCKGKSPVIRLLTIDNDKCPTIYPSLEAMFATILACIREKAFYVEDGEWRDDADLTVQVMERMNPRRGAFRAGQ